MAYITKSRRAEAIRYDGMNAAEITAFAGTENTSYDSTSFRVRGSGGQWKEMSPGDWVIRDTADGWMHPAAPETFARVWEQEQ